MARIIGVGPLTLDGVSLDDMASWDGNASLETDEIENLRAAVRDRVVKVATWDAKVERELTTTGRTAGALGIGSWNGVELVEYTFKVECDVAEADGALDVWRSYQPKATLDWSIDVEKWQAVPGSFGVFMAGLSQQATDQVRLQVTTPFGSGLGLCDKASFGVDGEVSKEKLTVNAAGTLTSADPWVARMIAAAAAVMGSGSANPLRLTGYVSPNTRPFDGWVFLKSVEYKVPSGKVTGSMELQGTGAPS